jgi:hypothetical protein
MLKQAFVTVKIEHRQSANLTDLPVTMLSRLSQRAILNQKVRCDMTNLLLVPALATYNDFRLELTTEYRVNPLLLNYRPNYTNANLANSLKPPRRAGRGYLKRVNRWLLRLELLKLNFKPPPFTLRKERVCLVYQNLRL